MVVAVEYTGGVKGCRVNKAIVKVMSGIWPRNEKQEKHCIARTLVFKIFQHFGKLIINIEGDGKYR